MKYTIKKGRHFAFPIFSRPMRLDKVRAYEIIFSDECFDSYVEEQGAVNKLFGWTDGLSLKGGFVDGKYKKAVHMNSRRLGWRPNKNKTITLLLYFYVDGVLTKTEKVNVKKTDGITYNVNSNKGELLKGVRHKYGWWLSPFFGGVLPSPNNCKITLNKIK